ncbi:tyrosine-type recombinase/integrase [Pedobacter sp. MW01-1-1]|uniref:tyrosine-type recombinase/integrase n=1 Tax=Pedobacter sp. MW01-1-1 TaxID=3383027 RepID=UPI003FEE024F
MKFERKMYQFELGQHKEKKVIWVKFKKDSMLIANLKEVAKAYWSNTKKCWYVLDVKQYRKLFDLPEHAIGEQMLKKIAEPNKKHFIRFRETLQLKMYSKNTLQIYCAALGHFLADLKNVDAESLSQERVRSYFIYCVHVLKLNENYLHSRINAVKFFYEKVLHREGFFLDIPRPKKASILPKAINKSDIKKMFSVIKNRKHLLMLKLCYGMGLRVSEIVNLKISDIDSKSMHVLVSQAKGKKDRYVNLPESILLELRQYYIEYAPKSYLFEGQRAGQYTIRSVQAVFKKALNEAKINKQVGIHSLRHSYATHLLEAGTDISFIKELLGHNNLKTTLRYTALANRMISTIKSPLDTMDEE